MIPRVSSFRKSLPELIGARPCNKCQPSRPFRGSCLAGVVRRFPSLGIMILCPFNLKLNNVLREIY
ncbi:hypothetical protein AG1IA_07046 [Rhizoctonia solani AG-1 IA]|uniref:Uncharacterized protein n=1 Tax=Thanatephorus cucumeris (strain AG1-IA) TaxID=983506 RepID=L8WQ78_THACA|nr:hypothetical protein AG1IA_07046 [Rhizoctonia solani AG-1 IA]